jgi:hypothetical protein
MSEERDIEKQLRAAAGQRRKGAGGKFELHPATRRVLQGEVARTLGTTNSDAQKSFFAGVTWLRFASAVCTLAILCFGTWVFVHNPKPPQNKIAEQAKFSTAASAPLAKPETAGYVQNAAMPASDASERLRDRAVEQPVAPLSMPVVTAAPAPAPVAVMPVLKPAKVAVAKLDSQRIFADEDKSVALGGKAGGASSTLAFDAPAAASAVSGTIAPAEKNAAQNFSYRNEGAALAGKGKSGVAQMDAVAEYKLKTANRELAKEAEQSAVLANFSVSQNGDRIRITDGDGSVYDGALLAADDAKATEVGALKLQSKKDSVALGAPAKQSARAITPLPTGNSFQGNSSNVRFAAAGTNLSLRQKISISGEFVNAAMPVTNALNFSNAAQNQNVSRMVNSGALLSNGRIIGKAVTTDGREIQLNAAPVSP